MGSSPSVFKPSRLRIIAAFLSVVLFSTQVLFAHSAEANFWEQRRKSTQIQPSAPQPRMFAQLPAAVPLRSSFTASPASSLFEKLRTQPPSAVSPELASIVPLLSVDGVVRNIKTGRGNSVIVYVQDVHGQPEAQKNIATLLLKIIERDPNAVIGLEGTKGTVPIERFRLSSLEVNKEVGSFFLNTGLITGAEYAGFAAPTTPRLVGVEDKDLYLKNVAAVQSALPRQKNQIERIENEKISLQLKKSAVYSPSLTALDQNERDYNAGTIGLGDYVSFLAHASPVAPSESIALFLKTWALEKTLDFDKAERERSEFLSRLVEKLDKSRLKNLVEDSVRLRSGAITYPAYYKSLKETAAAARLSLSQTPEFNRYVSYVLQADTIQPETLLSELTAFEKTSWALLCETSEQRTIYEASRRIVLTEKLVRLTLTPHEWAEYKSQILNSKYQTTSENLKNQKQTGLKFKNSAFAWDLGFDAWNLKSFESFYEAAEARNDALAGNFLEAADDSRSKIKVLIAGGFHTEGLTRLLAKSGATLITVSPKLSKVDPFKDNDYLNVFTRAKAPLEQLFKAPKISLVMTGSTHPLVPGLNVDADKVAELTAPLGRVLGEVERKQTGFQEDQSENYDVAAAADEEALPNRPADVEGKTDRGTAVRAYKRKGILRTLRSVAGRASRRTFLAAVLGVGAVLAGVGTGETPAQPKTEKIDEAPKAGATKVRALTKKLVENIRAKIKNDALGIDQDDLKIDRGEFVPANVLPLNDEMFDDPLKAPVRSAEYIEKLQQAQKPSDYLAVAQTTLGVKTAKGKEGGLKIGDDLAPEKTPKELRPAVNLLLAAVKNAQPLLKSSFDKLSDKERKQFLSLLNVPDAEGVLEEAPAFTTFAAMGKKFDQEKLFEAGRIVFNAIDQATALIEAATKGGKIKIKDKVKLKAGGLTIAFGSTGADTFDEDFLKDVDILIKVEGKSAYSGAVASARDGNIRIVIDRSADVTVDGGKKDFRGNAGAGVFGIGVMSLPNKEGTKKLTTGSFSQGAGIAGIGALLTHGKVISVADRSVHGFGAFGAGLFITDNAAGSSIDTAQFGLGASQVRGIGIFRHRGDDSKINAGIYYGDPREGYTSASLGFAFGDRSRGQAGATAIALVEGNEIKIQGSHMFGGTGYGSGSLGVAALIGNKNEIRGGRYTNSGVHHGFGSMFVEGDGNYIENWMVGPAFGWDNSSASFIMSGNKNKMNIRESPFIASVGASRTFSLIVGDDGDYKLPNMLQANSDQMPAYAMGFLEGNNLKLHAFSATVSQRRNAKFQRYNTPYGSLSVDGTLTLVQDLKFPAVKLPAKSPVERAVPELKRRALDWAKDLENTRKEKGEERVGNLVRIASAFIPNRTVPRQAMDDLLKLGDDDIPHLIKAIDRAYFDRYYYLLAAVPSHGDRTARQLIKSWDKLSLEQKRHALPFLRLAPPSIGLPFLLKILDDEKLKGIHGNAIQAAVGSIGGLRNPLNAARAALSNLDDEKTQAAVLKFFSSIPSRHGMAVLGVAAEMTGEQRADFYKATPPDIAAPMGEKAAGVFMNVLKKKSTDNLKRINGQLKELSDQEPKIRKKIGDLLKDKATSAPAVEALVQLQQKGDLPTFVQLLNSKTDRVRSEAARAIGRLEGASTSVLGDLLSSKNLEKHFKEKLSDKEKFRLKRLALIAVSYGKDPGFLTLLEQGLKDADPQIRLVALAVTYRHGGFEKEREGLIRAAIKRGDADPSMKWELERLNNEFPPKEKKEKEMPAALEEEDLAAHFDVNEEDDFALNDIPEAAFQEFDEPDDGVAARNYKLAENGAASRTWQWAMGVAITGATVMLSGLFAEAKRGVTWKVFLERHLPDYTPIIGWTVLTIFVLIAVIGFVSGPKLKEQGEAVLNLKEKITIFDATIKALKDSEDEIQKILTEHGYRFENVKVRSTLGQPGEAEAQYKRKIKRLELSPWVALLILWNGTHSSVRSGVNLSRSIDDAFIDDGEIDEFLDKSNEVLGFILAHESMRRWWILSHFVYFIRPVFYSPYLFIFRSQRPKRFEKGQPDSLLEPNDGRFKDPDDLGADERPVLIEQILYFSVIASPILFFGAFMWAFGPPSFTATILSAVVGAVMIHLTPLRERFVRSHSIIRFAESLNRAELEISNHVRSSLPRLTTAETLNENDVEIIPPRYIDSAFMETIKNFLARFATKDNFENRNRKKLVENTLLRMMRNEAARKTVLDVLAKIPENKNDPLRQWINGLLEIKEGEGPKLDAREVVSSYPIYLRKAFVRFGWITLLSTLAIFNIGYYALSPELAPFLANPLIVSLALPTFAFAAGNLIGALDHWRNNKWNRWGPNGELAASDDPGQQAQGNVVYQEGDVSIELANTKFSYSQDSSQVSTLKLQVGSGRMEVMAMDEAMNALTIYNRAHGNARQWKRGEELLTDSSAIRKLFRSFVEFFENLVGANKHPGWEFFTLYDNSNVFGNPNYIAFVDGLIYHGTGKEGDEEFNQNFNQPFLSLVQFPDGRLEMREIFYEIDQAQSGWGGDGIYRKRAKAYQANRETNGDWKKGIELKNISAFNGIPMIRDGKAADLSEIIRAGYFSDFRHVVSIYPLESDLDFIEDAGKKEAFQKAIKSAKGGLYFGSDQLNANGYEKLAQAVAGPVTLKNHIAVPVDGTMQAVALTPQEVREIFKRRNYKEIQGVPINPGEYRFIDETTVEVFFKPSPYPMLLYGETESGDVIVQSVGGASGRTGITLVEMPAWAQKHGIKNLFIGSQGTGSLSNYAPKENRTSGNFKLVPVVQGSAVEQGAKAAREAATAVVTFLVKKETVKKPANRILGFFLPLLLICAALFAFGFNLGLQLIEHRKQEAEARKVDKEINDLIRPSKAQPLDLRSLGQDQLFWFEDRSPLEHINQFDDRRGVSFLLVHGDAGSSVRYEIPIEAAKDQPIRYHGFKPVYEGNTERVVGYRFQTFNEEKKPLDEASLQWSAAEGMKLVFTRMQGNILGKPISYQIRFPFKGLTPAITGEKIPVEPATKEALLELKTRVGFHQPPGWTRDIKDPAAALNALTSVAAKHPNHILMNPGFDADSGLLVIPLAPKRDMRPYWENFLLYVYIPGHGLQELKIGPTALAPRTYIQRARVQGRRSPTGIEEFRNDFLRITAGTNNSYVVRISFRDEPSDDSTYKAIDPKILESLIKEAIRREEPKEKGPAGAWGWLFLWTQPTEGKISFAAFFETVFFVGVIGATLAAGFLLPYYHGLGTVDLALLNLSEPLLTFWLSHTALFTALAVTVMSFIVYPVFATLAHFPFVIKRVDWKELKNPKPARVRVTYGETSSFWRAPPVRYGWFFLWRPGDFWSLWKGVISYNAVRSLPFLMALFLFALPSSHPLIASLFSLTWPSWLQIGGFAATYVLFLSLTALFISGEFVKDSDGYPVYKQGDAQLKDPARLIVDRIISAFFLSRSDYFSFHAVGGDYAKFRMYITLYLRWSLLYALIPTLLFQIPIIGVVLAIWIAARAAFITVLTSSDAHWNWSFESTGKGGPAGTWGTSALLSHWIGKTGHEIVDVTEKVETQRETYSRIAIAAVEKALVSPSLNEADRAVVRGFLIETAPVQSAQIEHGFNYAIQRLQLQIGVAQAHYKATSAQGKTPAAEFGNILFLAGLADMPLAAAVKLFRIIGESLGIEASADDLTAGWAKGNKVRQDIIEENAEHPYYAASDSAPSRPLEPNSHPVMHVDTLLSGSFAGKAEEETVNHLRQAIRHFDPKSNDAAKRTPIDLVIRTNAGQKPEEAREALIDRLKTLGAGDAEFEEKLSLMLNLDADAYSNDSLDSAKGVIVVEQEGQLDLDLIEEHSLAMRGFKGERLAAEKKAQDVRFFTATPHEVEQRFWAWVFLIERNLWAVPFSRIVDEERKRARIYSSQA